MPKKGINIFKRKDGRWEARYVKEISADGSKKYGSVYGKSFSEAKEKQQLCIRNIHLYQRSKYNLTLCAVMYEWLEFSRNSIKVTSKNISPKAKKYGIIEPTNKVGDLDAVESICRR